MRIVCRKESVRDKSNRCSGALAAGSQGSGKELETRHIFRILFLSLVISVFIIAGCETDPDTAVDPDYEEEIDDAPEPDLPEETVPDPDEKDPAERIREEEDIDEPLMAGDYFWPWISHSQLTLSSGEVIDGPHLFESDAGFVAEFTKEYDYSGRMVWLVENTDVFTIEWVTLNFDVEYYKENEWVFDFQVNLEFDDLKPEPADEGLQEFELDITEEQEGFKVVVDKIILGKEEEGSFITDPIDFVALDIEMTVVDKP